MEKKSPGDFKSWRKAKGLTQAQAGVLLGVSAPTIAKMDSGKLHDPLKVLDRVKRKVPAADQEVLSDILARMSDSVIVDLTSIPEEERSLVLKAIRNILSRLQ